MANFRLVNPDEKYAFKVINLEMPFANSSIAVKTLDIQN